MKPIKIMLPNGWYIELDDSTREEGYQGFVFSPDGNHSASITCARYEGVVEGNGNEKPIPETIKAELRKSKYDQYE